MYARTVAAEVLQTLRAVPNLVVFDGEVPDKPEADADGRVYPYVVVYSGGLRGYSSRLSGDTSDWAGDTQVTCAAGRTDSCLWAVDKVRDALGDVRLSDGNWLTEPYDSGPLRRDDDVSPPRFYLPLTFRIA